MTKAPDVADLTCEHSGKYWVRVLAKYREPSHPRSIAELALTLIPFAALIGLAWWALSVSYLLAGAISALNGAFLVRLFIIQHDCGHNAFFRNRTVNDWTGRLLGVLTLTPYDVWRQTHAIHHASTGNLDRRGIGDLPVQTLAEYRAAPWRKRLAYRIYRNPFFLFGLAPAWLFFVQNRLPVGLMGSGRRYWVSAMATNLAIAALVGAGIYLSQGLHVLFLILPMALVGASAGVWLFYVQHQFEDAHWNREADWQIHDAALHGSSHYVLPPVLKWFSGNIGIHHVHHLYSRIPFYRLTEVLRDHPALDRAQRLTLRESLHCARLHLWDERSRKLLSFAEARAA
ncbi:fatty acid desaturase [Defluviimonas sp. 20V17]|uniref:Fatty acid desaturase n=1 Tax=Allgaiera indica TaxID=765699 RepID=A0AAN4ZZ04_9RHOB|nr:fatty acid desaturase [Allgaiera indica]KDB03067.1 fatty acid desaturase [Defluviimonas sp. 20V17]GHE00840.1 fatty acid desaturase [Allgaiera indica]SDW72889.1 omega-6 fatty acid desaturase (delta-12 desaturase) [Allgaiera indica]